MAEQNPDRMVIEFLEHYRQGFVCLHPTDTLPGLSFDPLSELGLRSLWKVKGERQNKAFNCLVANWQQALAFWQPLPSGWSEILAKLWPAPLSVVWFAKKSVPEVLKALDGSISLRVPDLGPEAKWFQAVLEGGLTTPFPSTSVNRSGNAPAVSWADARSFLENQKSVYTPTWDCPQGGFQGASTVIKIRSDGGFDVLRKGLMSVELISQLKEEVQ